MSYWVQVPGNPAVGWRVEGEWIDAVTEAVDAANERRRAVGIHAGDCDLARLITDHEPACDCRTFRVVQPGSGPVYPT